ncbi:MAG TPA: hypothetical protein D7H91_04675 [Candidatus Poseidoniales archaeon]|nr:MAG TPA: hypothetical protein D7H91_04675 [Candidatus Poseidoniales archaeon]HII78315.1 hypothetical protein [Poseidonia sp.]
MSASVWMGYLIDHHDNFTVVQSPFVLDGLRVFGADSDATTLGVAALFHRLQHESVESVSVPEGMDGMSLSMATGVPLHTGEGEADWDVLMSDEATVVLARHGCEVELTSMDVEVQVDADFHQAMQQAWDQELSSTHVSQGAYVSRAQYEEGGTSRLSLTGQSAEGGLLWPPRFNHVVDGSKATNRTLQRTGKVQTWTTLSAAGAPSEFSLRAPLLGGISTVLLQLDEGPKGVFLTVDDEDALFEMEASMELVVRRLYAQEGFIRYGLKARTVYD